ncbi:MAG: hypothetical protein ACOX2F_08120 [bacterium]
MRYSILFFVFLSFVPVFAEKAPEWKLVENSKKIKLYTREKGEEGIKEVKATATISGTVDEALEVLFDRNNHPKIFKYIKFSDQMKRTANCDWSYNIIDAPMASDRDYLVKSCKVNAKDGSTFLKWEPFEDAKYPENKKKVRVLINKGYWKFTQVKPDELQVNYYIYTDPAGQLPLWIKNVANKKAVPDAIFTVEKEIEKRRKAKAKKEK